MQLIIDKPHAPTPVDVGGNVRGEESEEKATASFHGESNSYRGGIERGRVLASGPAWGKGFSQILSPRASLFLRPVDTDVMRNLTRHLCCSAVFLLAFLPSSAWADKSATHTIGVTLLPAPTEIREKGSLLTTLDSTVFTQTSAITPRSLKQRGVIEVQSKPRSVDTRFVYTVQATPDASTVMATLTVLP